jgi:hypothetical protein
MINHVRVTNVASALTGESQFHISTPLGIEPGSLMTGSKGWPTGPVRLCMNAVRLQALHNRVIISDFLTTFEISWTINNKGQ